MSVKKIGQINHLFGKIQNMPSLELHGIILTDMKNSLIGLKKQKTKRNSLILLKLLNGT